MRLPGVKSSEFRQKIILSIIDKIVLAVIAAVLLGGIAEIYKQQATLRDQAFVVSKIYTDLLVDHRKKLTAAVEAYLPLLEEAKTVGRIQDVEHRAALKKVLQDLRIVNTTVSTLIPELGVQTEAFVQLTSTMNVKLMTRTQTPVDIEKQEETLLNRYQSLLDAFKEATRNIVESEYAQ